MGTPLTSHLCPRGVWVGKQWEERTLCDSTQMRSLQSSDSQRLVSGQWAPGPGEEWGQCLRGTESGWWAPREGWESVSQGKMGSSRHAWWGCLPNSAYKILCYM